VTIIITFTPEQEKKYLEFEFLDKKSNIKDYILKIYDDSNTIIENINGSNLKDRILSKKIISVDKLISKIEIIIISTTDKKPPCHVQISIKGYPSRCESSTKHTTKHLTTSHTTSHTNFKVTSSSSSKKITTDIHSSTKNIFTSTPHRTSSISPVKSSTIQITGSITKSTPHQTSISIF